jgi:hypothetical protein
MAFVFETRIDAKLKGLKEKFMHRDNPDEEPKDRAARLARTRRHLSEGKEGRVTQIEAAHLPPEAPLSRHRREETHARPDRKELILRKFVPEQGVGQRGLISGAMHAEFTAEGQQLGDVIERTAAVLQKPMPELAHALRGKDWRRPEERPLETRNKTGHISAKVWMGPDERGLGDRVLHVTISQEGWNRVRAAYAEHFPTSMSDRSQTGR